MHPILNKVSNISQCDTFEISTIKPRLLNISLCDVYRITIISQIDTLVKPLHVFYKKIHRVAHIEPRGVCYSIVFYMS